MGHLQYRDVVFGTVNIEHEGLKQTSWKRPLSDRGLTKVLHEDACRPKGPVNIPGLGKTPVGMSRKC